MSEIMETTLRQKAGLVLFGCVAAVLLLVVFEIIFDLTGAWAPEYRYGDFDLGFSDPIATGSVRTFRANPWLFLGSDSGLVTLNERGFCTSRTIREILRSPPGVGIAVIGDSHTMLPYRNDLMHPSILERELRDKGVVDAEVFNAGRGGYSPLQAYLYFQRTIKDLHPTILILNLYTGNDFFDMMRIDDRPTFRHELGGGYSIQSPRWYRLTDPADRGRWWSKSRVLFLIKTGLAETGLDNLSTRMLYLLEMGREQGASLIAALSYVRRLAWSRESSLAYPPAFSAQVLNQYLFFASFSGTKEESLRRLAYLFSLIRRERPGLLCILSPIPSASLSGALHANEVFQAKLEELGINYPDLLAQEQSLYDGAILAAGREGWLVIDNLQTFRANGRSTVLFMNEDLHVSPAGSEAIGRNEATALLHLLQRGSDGKSFLRASSP
jgi:hypothetical protein